MYTIRMSGQIWSQTSINGHAAEEEEYEAFIMKHSVYPQDQSSMASVYIGTGNYLNKAKKHSRLRKC